MTIFDAIRYPVTDIFDPKQIDHIPLVILIPWIKDCVEFINWDKTVDYYSATGFAECIEYIVKQKSLGVHRSVYDENFIEAFKANFTMKLRRRINDYNPNL